MSSRRKERRRFSVRELKEEDDKEVRGGSKRWPESQNEGEKELCDFP